MANLYKLEPYNGIKSRHRCPGCNKGREFTRYINDVTGEYLPFQYGKCNRIEKCNYHVWPTKSAMDIVTAPRRREKQKPKKYLYRSIYKRRLYRNMDINYFVDYLTIILGVENTHKICRDYLLGTGDLGTVLFPYFDDAFNLVTYKTMLYDLMNGKRNKKRFGYYDSNKQKHSIQLFGLHLIKKYPDLPIMIVESEKTAVIMSVLKPECLWLATGGAGMLTAKKLEDIKHRDVYLFPDQAQYKYWSKKMQECQLEYSFLNISISKECENWHEAGDLKDGGDIADYWTSKVKFNHEFQMILPIV